MRRQAPLLIGWAAVALRLSDALRTADDAASRSHAYEQAQHDAEHQIASQWRQLEGELEELQRIAEPRRGVSILQVGATPAGKAAKAPPADAPVVGEAAAVGALAGKTSKATLVPMLAMLKNLYEEQKGRISKINKQEELSKARFAEQEKDHKAKLAHMEERFRLHKVSEEFYHNETRDAEHQFTYWRNCRERNHRQFHNSLKITHATMEKEKAMIKAYEETLAAPTPTGGAKALAKVARDVGMPEIVLLQTVKRFCRSALAEVRSTLREIGPTA